VSDGSSRTARVSLESPAHERPSRALTVTDIAAREADYLWMTLQRLGVRRDDCGDVLQQVLLTVHQRLHTYDATMPLRPWLYGVCLRHAAAHRRRAYVRREQPTDADSPALAHQSTDETPERSLARREQQARLDAMLDEVDPEKRAVLVMFELEEQSCEEISNTLGVPVGTVHSRLHAARRAFRAVFDRWLARDRGANR